MYRLANNVRLLSLQESRRCLMVASHPPQTFTFQAPISAHLTAHSIRKAQRPLFDVVHCFATINAVHSRSSRNYMGHMELKRDWRRSAWKNNELNLETMYSKPKKNTVTWEWDFWFFFGLSYRPLWMKAPAGGLQSAPLGSRVRSARCSLSVAWPRSSPPAVSVHNILTDKKNDYARWKLV